MQPLANREREVAMAPGTDAEGFERWRSGQLDVAGRASQWVVNHWHAAISGALGREMRVAGAWCSCHGAPPGWMA
jgi:hypothetical protein